MTATTMPAATDVAMPAALQALVEAGALERLDVHLARTLGRLGGEHDPRVLLAAALASRATGDGHVCVDLRRRVATPLTDEEGAPVAGFEWPALPAWTAALRASRIVGAPGDDGTSPLVLDSADRLYLRRYWRYQSELAERLRARSGWVSGPVDDPLLRSGLRRLFPPGAGPAPPVAGDGGGDGGGGDGGGGGPDRQAVAAAVAVTRRLAVVSGGPGTGKTATVVRILALLVEQALAARREPPTALLLAPTGKAAARLVESVRAAKARLDVSDAVRAAIPEDAKTIHRALRPRPDRPTAFRHDARDPLPADVVVVDEASMVDLALMAKLVAAVPPAARLVLLGDRDQLSSVEAGAILGDICGDDGGGAAGPERRSAAALRRLEAALGELLLAPPGAPAETGFGDGIVHLVRSWRFGAGSGIGALARAVNAGRGDEALAVLADPRYPDATHAALPPGGGLGPAFAAAVRRGFAAFLKAADPLERLARLADFRVLCAHRTGPYGVEQVNRVIEGLLRADGLLRGSEHSYAGRPVIVTTNDYSARLFNGDMGVLDPDPEAGGALRAFFPAPDGGVRRVLPARLPTHETAWALTVHKSQGSEFDEVLLLLPATVSRVLSRELVYTGITRARKSVTVLSPPEVIVESAARRVERASGLRDALWS